MYVCTIMKNESHELHNLAEKSFDEMYDETRSERPHASLQEVQALVEAKMHMRNHQMHNEKIKCEARANLKEIQPTSLLHQGALNMRRANAPLEQRRDVQETFEEFSQRFEYLRKKNPCALLEMHIPVWELAETDIEAAILFKEQMEQELHIEVEKKADELFEGPEGRAMQQWIEKYLS